MSKIKKMRGFLICLILALCMSACEWNIYHYYERAENGIDVFLDETNYYIVTIDDKSFAVAAKDSAFEDVYGTYEWTKDDEAEVIMKDGSHCTVQVKKNNKKHNANAEWDLYVVETNMYYVLENTKGE